MEEQKLSIAEYLWLERLKKYLSDYKYDYVCSWWLRCEYQHEGITTHKINHILSKLVAKGILKKETNRSYTKFSLNITSPSTLIGHFKKSIEMSEKIQLKNKTTDGTKPVLSAAIRLKKAKQYFAHIKKYNKKLKELGFHLSDSYSTICLFDSDNEDSIDSL